MVIDLHDRGRADMTAWACIRDTGICWKCPVKVKADPCSAAREEQEEPSWKGRDGRELTAQHSSQPGAVRVPSDPDPPGPASASSAPPALALLWALCRLWAEPAMLRVRGVMGTVWNRCRFKTPLLTPPGSASSLLSFSPQHQLMTACCAV